MEASLRVAKKKKKNVMSAVEAPKLSYFSNSKKYFYAEYQVKITMVYMGPWGQDKWDLSWVIFPEW